MTGTRSILRSGAALSLVLGLTTMPVAAQVEADCGGLEGDALAACRAALEATSPADEPAAEDTEPPAGAEAAP